MSSDVEAVTRALPRLVDAVRTRGHRDVAAASELTEHQLRTLTLLDDEDPTMVGELAEFTGVTASTMSLNLKRLQERGFVVRSRDPADRRVMNVRLTDRGRVAKEAASVVDRVRVDRMLGMLRPEARRQAVSGLALLAGAADRLIAQGEEHVEALAGPRPDRTPGGEGVGR